jgi:hypothetical protein
MDVIITILNDMWAGLLDYESGFIFAFLGVGAVLVTLIQAIITLLNTSD